MAWLRSMRGISFALLLLLTACQRDAAPKPAAADQRMSTGSGLERAAIETGAIADPARTSPIGLYQHRHEAGRDALCIVPAANDQYRFGAEAIFGREQSCRGEGWARRAGDKLVLRFSRGPGCIIVAQYDGDQVSLPGVVDMKCASLCRARGSFEAVTFPRVASYASAAYRANARDGTPLCPR